MGGDREPEHHETDRLDTEDVTEPPGELGLERGWERAFAATLDGTVGVGGIVCEEGAPASTVIVVVHCCTAALFCFGGWSGCCCECGGGEEGAAASTAVEAEAEG